MSSLPSQFHDTAVAVDGSASDDEGIEENDSYESSFIDDESDRESFASYDAEDELERAEAILAALESQDRQSPVADE